MAFSTTDNEATVINEVRNIFKAFIPESDAWKDPSFFGINATVVGGAIWTVLNEARNGIDMRVNPQTAVGENLDRIAATPPLNLIRLAPTVATGFIRGEGLTVVVVNTGEVFETADGRKYTAITNATVTGGIATIEVTAMVAGEVANAIVDTPFISLLDGMFFSDGIFGGFDMECDEALRRRVFAGYSTTAFFGSQCSYTTAIEAMAGVTRSWVVADGGMPRIVFLMEDKYPTGQPLEADIDAIKAEFDADCKTSIFYCANIVGAIPLVVAPEIEWLVTPPNIQDVQDAMKGWLRENYGLGETVRSASVQLFLDENFPQYCGKLTCEQDYDGQCNGVYNVVQILGPC